MLGGWKRGRGKSEDGEDGEADAVGLQNAANVPVVTMWAAGKHGKRSTGRCLIALVAVWLKLLGDPTSHSGLYNGVNGLHESAQVGGIGYCGTALESPLVVCPYPGRRSRPSQVESKPEMQRLGIFARGRAICGYVRLSHMPRNASIRHEKKDSGDSEPDCTKG